MSETISGNAPDATLNSIEETTAEAGVRAAWGQWARFSARTLQGSNAERAWSIIDPEALLLLYLIPVEWRLRDLVHW